MKRNSGLDNRNSDFSLRAQSLPCYAPAMRVQSIQFDSVPLSGIIKRRRPSQDQASPAETAAALEHTDFSKGRLTKLLLSLRALGRKQPNEETGTQVERLRRAGFIELANVPQKEIMYGVVGRFWRPDSNIITGLSAVIAFHAEGYAKAVWNFSIAAEPERISRLSTETRIQPFGRSARWKFRA
jgi:hypothetical protein